MNGRGSSVSTIRLNIFLIFFLGALFQKALSSEVEACPSLDIQKREIREFVLYNYRPLALDVLNDQGQYLESLLALVDPKELLSRRLLIKKIRDNLLKEQSVPDFARSVTNYVKCYDVNNNQ